MRKLIGATFGALMQDVDAFLLSRRTYVTPLRAARGEVARSETFEALELAVGRLFGELAVLPQERVARQMPTAHLGRCQF